MRNPTLVEGFVEPIDGNADSLFICCSSYEERSTLGIRRLSRNYRSSYYLICRAREYEDKGAAPTYYEETYSRLKKASDQIVEIDSFAIDDSIGFVSALDRKLKSLDGADVLREVTVDISTFPREELLLLLRYLDNHVNRGRIRLLYAEPAKYATELEDEDKRWLTRGVRSVHSVPGFGGIQFPDRQKILLVILGHEGERTHISIRRHQPDKVVFIPQGKEQHHEGLREISELQSKEILSRYGKQNIWHVGLPSRGVVETAKVVSKIFQTYRYSYNVFIAPNGTKLQLIGVYLVARKFPEIQITYAAPAIYNSEAYSAGTGLLWEIMLEPL